MTPLRIIFSDVSNLRLCRPYKILRSCLFPIMVTTKYSRTHLGITTQRPTTTVYPTENSTNKPPVTLKPHNGGKESRSSSPEVFVKKLFLEISQNLQEHTCTSVSFLIKLTLLKKSSGTGVFLLIFLRTPFLKEHLRWLLLEK